MTTPIQSTLQLPAKNGGFFHRARLGLYSALATVLVGGAGNYEPPVVAGDKPAFKTTDPNEVNNPQRSFTRDKLNQELENKWCYEKWYRNARFYTSVSDQVKYAKRHNDLPLEGEKSYIKLWVKDESSVAPLNGKLCRAYVSENLEGESVYALFLGHVENLDKNPEYSGIVDLYNKLVKRNKGIVLLFRTAYVMDELNSWLNCNGNYAYNPEVIEEHTKNIMSYFTDKYKDKGIKDIKLLGYSRGGGMILNLSHDEDWRGGLPVTESIMLDAVHVGCTTSSVRERPEFDESENGRHIHIFQKPEINPLGGPLTQLVQLGGDYPIKRKYYWGIFYKTVRDQRGSDVHWEVKNTDHNSVDDVKEVKDWVLYYLTENR